MTLEVDGIVYVVPPVVQPFDQIQGQPTPAATGGELMWYRHVRRDEGTFEWEGPKKVGTGWGDFTRVFSGGDGIIYAVQENGELLWYRHVGQADGTFKWEGPKKVGTGWGDFVHAFSSGNGIVYVVPPVVQPFDQIQGQPTPAATGGELMWYRHVGRDEGTFEWEGPKKVGTGWGEFVHVFAAESQATTNGDGWTGSSCGFPDQGRSGGTRPLTFGLPIGRWTRGSLKVSINLTGCNFVNAPAPAPPTTPLAVITGAFAQWDAASSYFNFTFVPPGTGEDIQVVFGQIDGVGQKLGSAAPPESGNILIDAAETWTTGLLLGLAIHEVGHVLGLGHSNTPGATMNPFANSTVVTIDAESLNAISLLYGWRPQKLLPDRATSSRPSLGVTRTSNFTDVFETPHMVWKGSADDSGIYFSEFRGGQWTPQAGLSGAGCSYSPSLATTGGGAGLLMAWKGAPGDNSLYWTRYNGAVWENQRPGPDAGTSAGPALAFVNGQNYMAWKGAGDDSGIYWSTHDGAESWSPQAPVDGVGTSASPALVGLNGRLYMFWKGIEGDSNAYWSSYDFVNDPIWKPQRVVAYYTYKTTGGVPHAIGTSGALSAAVRGSGILLIWKGAGGDSTIWFSLFENDEFSGQAVVPDVGTSEGAGIIHAGDTTYLAWKGTGDDNGIYWTSL